MEPVDKRFDLSDLQQYGIHVELFPDGRVPPFWKLDKFAEVLSKRLKQINFDATTDSFAVLGKSVYLLLMALLTFSEHNEINLLIYDSNFERYTKFTLKGAYERSISGSQVSPRTIVHEVPRIEESNIHSTTK